MTKFGKLIAYFDLKKSKVIALTGRGGPQGCEMSEVPTFSR
jgi:hypothetical protein